MSVPEYHPLFTAAFPHDPQSVTFSNVTAAIAEFERGTPEHCTSKPSSAEARPFFIRLRIEKTAAAAKVAAEIPRRSN
jgi:hypothetical protein